MGPQPVHVPAAARGEPEQADLGRRARSQGQQGRACLFQRVAGPVRLRERERQQSTQLPGAVALIGITKGQVPTTTLGVFTLDKPVAWGGPSREPVDLCLVVLSPPGERQVQLWMLGRLARMIPQNGFLDELRGAGTEEMLLQVLREADEHLDDYLNTSEDTGPGDTTVS